MRLPKVLPSMSLAQPSVIHPRNATNEHLGDVSIRVACVYNVTKESLATAARQKKKKIKTEKKRPDRVWEQLTIHRGQTCPQGHHRDNASVQQVGYPLDHQI